MNQAQHYLPLKFLIPATAPFKFERPLDQPC